MLFKLERHAEAAQTLAEAQHFAPALHTAAIYRACALVGCGAMEEARSVIKSVPTTLGLSVDEANTFARACLSLNLFKEAESVLVRAAASNPADQALKVNLAHVYERTNRVSEAAALLEQVAAPDPLAKALKARLLSRTGQDQAAVQALDALRQEVAAAKEDTADLLAQIEFDRGRLLDRAGDHAGALQAFRTGNALDRDAYVKRHPGAQIEGGLDWLPRRAVEDAARVSADASGGAEPDPVFLVGFPRSGTTLLDQILDAHSAIDVLEEKPLADVLTRALSAGISDPAQLRGRYWAAVDSYLKRTPGNLFVDKNPFGVCNVQLLARVFPAARWIFAIRHPLDAIFSCYSNRFHYTPYSHGFWDLREIAAIYRDSIGLWLEQSRQLDLKVHRLKYEDLVVNAEAEARALLAFLGLEWESGVLQYHRHALTRSISTPSYDQVVKPIYGDSVERWRHYSGAMADIFDLIRPFAGTLGYETGDWDAIAARRRIGA